MTRNKATFKNRIISGILAVMMIAGIFGTWPLTIVAEEPVAQNAVDVWDGSIANGFGGGSGTQASPFLIYTGAQLAYLASSTNAGNSYSGKYFKLMNDIDLNNINWTPIGLGSLVGDDNGSSSYLFKGIFDGNNCKITNLYINQSSLMKVALFGSIANATIKSLGIEEASVTMTYGNAMSYGSILCAAAYNSTISGCYAIGSLSVTNTRSTPGHNATAGMIVGRSDKVSITDCYAEGSVAAISSGGSTYKSYAGGLVGLAASNTTNINRAYFVGSVSARAQAENAYASGLIGCGSSTISIANSFCSATVSATTSGNYKAYVSATYAVINSGTGSQSVSKCYQAGMQTNGTVVNSATATSLDNFKSSSWLASNLGWDFTNTWKFDTSNGYEYPVLKGFSAVGGNNNHTHEYTTNTVAPTCDAEGYTEYVCSCGHSYQEDTVPALGHNFVDRVCTRCGEGCVHPAVIMKIEPTCTEDGLEYFSCENCGYYIEYGPIPALGHEFVNGSACTRCGENCTHICVTMRTEPTCTQTGLEYFSCEECGYYTEYGTIPALGHDVNQDGYCTRCNRDVTAPEADIWDGSIATNFGGGSGTQDDPYLIYTGAQLARLAYNCNLGDMYLLEYFKLMNNIDLNNIEWTPIARGSLSGDHIPTTTFRGTFDGNGYAIFNLYIANNNTSFAGLFGGTSGATIQNLAIVGANVTNAVGSSGSPRSKVGALIGHANNTTVSNCSVVDARVCASALSSPSSAGGLIGIVYGYCTITNCYVSAEVISNGHVGGIVGGNYASGTSTIQNCYVVGKVIFGGEYNSGVSKVIAGIIGYSQATINIQNCFVAAEIVTQLNGSEFAPICAQTAYINQCYYNISYNGSAYGTATPLSNFQSKEWLISTLGWDFENVWDFDTSNGYNYPVLKGFVGGNGGTGGGGNVCNHNYTESVVAPTCTEDGYTLHKCTLCNDEYKDNYVTKPGHTPGAWIIEQEATCTTSGRKHSDCTVCGQQLENIYIPPLTHNYVTVVTREVTCTTPGILTHTCDRCGNSYTTYVYSEHAYAITEQVQPDCYTDGYTVYTCSNCQDQYTETIPGGHTYKSVITKVATSEEDGEITYTCEVCQDCYTEVIPAREAANVLLVQDRYPWGENNNVALLNQMLNDGYITGWDITTTSNFASIDIGMYNVILIANDQSTATYNQLNYLNDTLMQFATAGGVIIYGACDHGWAGGDISYSLPEGVVKKNFYSRYNYIVDTNHLIVSGILTDGKALTNSLLYGNYCSHTAFEASSLPANANVILQDAHGDATLVEYAVGDGHIILSGLTWEFYYNRNCYDGRTNTSYTKNVYDDLIMYALNLSDPCEHLYDEGVAVDPTCTEDGYTLHTCQNCGATMKDNIVPALEHIEGDWEVTAEPTQTEEGLKELRCTRCGEVLRSEVLPPIDGPTAWVESESDYVAIGDEIVFTLVIENCDPIKSLSVVPVFDSNIFEIVSAEWLLEDAMIQDIEEGTYKSVSVWSDYVDVNRAVYRVVLRAKDFAAYTGVGFSLKVEDEEGVVTVVPKTVSIVECPHTQTTVELIDDTYHARVCTHCGYAVMEEHVYDDIYDADCNACGHQRPLKGDVDNDGDVDVDDCIYLIYSVFFGTEDYPVYQSLDFDGDGIVCSEDGVYLLYYVYNGAGQYPLH